MPLTYRTIGNALVVDVREPVGIASRASFTAQLLDLITMCAPGRVVVALPLPVVTSAAVSSLLRVRHACERASLPFAVVTEDAAARQVIGAAAAPGGVYGTLEAALAEGAVQIRTAE